LAHARQHPNEFVLGVDPSTGAMRESSHRAARRRTALPNARFAVSALDALPVELDGRFDLVTVHFPWGSLWDASTAHDPCQAARLAALLRPGGELRLLLSHAARDGTPALDPEAVIAAHARHGLAAVEVRPAGLEDATAAHSSWGKRLLRVANGSRSAWLIRLNRPAADSGTRD
jgi:hypothetical protein